MRAPVVVKLGGELLGTPATLGALSDQLAALSDAGLPLVLVHGGGPQVTRLQRDLGIEPRIVAGRRVTDERTLEIAKMVFAGALNTDLVAALVSRSVPAVGLTGIDGALIRAHRRPPRVVDLDGRPQSVDYGLVGDVDGVEPRLLTDLASREYVPVVASLAADAGGAVLNVNADTVAAELAAGLGADSLVVLTAVPGVYRDFARKGEIWERLSPSQAVALVASGGAGGGMGPKLAACALAVEGGVRAAYIVDGTRVGLVTDLLLHGVACGTRVSADTGSAGSFPSAAAG